MNCVFVAHGVSGDFLRLTQIVSTNIHKINQNGKYILLSVYFYIGEFLE